MDSKAASEDFTTQSPATMPLPTPNCYGIQELSTAFSARTQTSEILSLLSNKEALSQTQLEFTSTSLYIHLSSGLALTTGSALGCKPPTAEQCLSTFQTANGVGLTAGARAWTKHAHRSQEYHPSSVSKGAKGEAGWWGRASGPKDYLNEGAYQLFCKIMKEASWKNVHMLPHDILAYEIRVPEGYGMRWSQDRGLRKEGEVEVAAEEGQDDVPERPWIFRGFVEPMMENGHELGWRHAPHAPVIGAKRSLDENISSDDTSEARLDTQPPSS